MRFLAPIGLGALVLGSSQLAHANGYIALGRGDGTHWEENAISVADHTSHYLLILGQRFGAVSLEASLLGEQMQLASGAEDSVATSTLLSLGFDVKYSVGILGGLEGYGKVGLNKTWLGYRRPNSGIDWQSSGRGTRFGLGLQYTVNIALGQLGVWLDHAWQNTFLVNDAKQGTDAEISITTLGLVVGF